ncbi:MAG: ABC-2 family transporter protein [Chloroflexia bacterium]|nr:ABC-2 family transporter protein [Chloroflexia bacterium]
MGKRRPKYLAIAATWMQQALAYRVTTLFNILITFIWVFILYALWEAAFAESGTISGYTWEEMRTYILLAYGINALVGWRVAGTMMGTIRTGEITRELTRPLDYRTTQLATAAGMSVVEGLISLILILVLGTLFFDVQAPDSVLAGTLFAIAMLTGFVIKALCIFLISLLCFWTLNAVGLMWAQQSLISILSGTLIPLAMLPGWLRIVAEILPLRGIVSTPLQIYLGKAEGWDLASLLALQFGWLAVLWAFAGWAWKRAFDAVEIQGG